MAVEMADDARHNLGRPLQVLTSGNHADPSEHLSDHIVYVVEDDHRVRAALDDLLASCGYNAQTFGSAAEFIAHARPSLPGCLVLDIELPDINGLELQRQLADQAHPPIVFITGHGDIPSSVRAMKAGAVDFLPKPFSEEQLLAAVNSALARDRKARTVNAELQRLRARHAMLTPRERETLRLIVSGLRNKQAAAVLGISLVTIQIHRGNIMRKMQAGSLSDLVRMSETLQIPRYCAKKGEPPRADGPGRD
jgi:FixJ family two-component response regulator